MLPFGIRDEFTVSAQVKVKGVQCAWLHVLYVCRRRSHFPRSRQRSSGWPLLVPGCLQYLMSWLHYGPGRR